MLGRVGGDYGHPEGYCISKIVRCGCDGQTTMHSALFRVRIQKLVDDDRHEDTGELGWVIQIDHRLSRSGSQAAGDHKATRPDNLARQS